MTTPATSAASSAPSTAAPRAQAAAIAPRAAAPSVPFKSLLLAPRARPAAAAAGASAPAARPATSAPRVREGEAAHDPADGRRQPTASHAEKESAPLKKRATDDPLDPAARHAAQIAPPQTAAPPSLATVGSTAPEVHAHASLEELLPALVKKIAWAGDKKSGSVRMELGAGALAGATVTVHADDGRVRVEIAAPAGANREEWRARIEERLVSRGLAVEHVLVS